MSELLVGVLVGALVGAAIGYGYLLYIELRRGK